MTIFVDFYKIYDQFNQFEKIAKTFVSKHVFHCQLHFPHVLFTKNKTLILDRV